MKSKDLGTLNHKLCFAVMSVVIVGEVATDDNVRSRVCSGIAIKVGLYVDGVVLLTELMSLCVRMQLWLRSSSVTLLKSCFVNMRGE